MKTDTRPRFSTRRAISQSLDLFIIIAAVLAAGGVTSAAVLGMIGSGSSSSTLQVLQSTLVGGSPSTVSLTLKNVGTQTLSAASATLTLGVNGAPNATCVTTGSVTWTTSCTTAVPMTWTSTVTLAPGAQVSFSATLVGTGPVIPGNSYTATIQIGSDSLSVKLVAE
jgi:hypothetical protein